MPLFGRKDTRPDGLVWQDDPGGSYPYEPTQGPDIEGLHYMAKGRGGSIEVDGDTIHVFVGSEKYRSHGNFTNSVGGVEMAKKCLEQFKHL